MFLSIITPFYNNFDDVKKCISNLGRQTLNNFELILINDASTEIGGEELNMKIQSSTIPIKLIHNSKNFGPGFSRNIGIEHAEGEFITFLDSDDYLEENAVEIIFRHYKQYNFDCMVFDYYLCGEKCKIARTAFKLKQGLIKNDLAFINVSGSTCCKVYKSEVIKNNHILFPEMYIKEDMPFNKAAIYFSSVIYYYRQPLYYYIKKQKSLMHQENAYDIHNDIAAYYFLKAKIKPSSDLLECIFSKELLYAGVLHLFLNGEGKLAPKYIKEWEREYPMWYKNRYNKHFPLHLKITLLLIKLKILWPIKFIAVIKLISKF